MVKNNVASIPRFMAKKYDIACASLCVASKNGNDFYGAHNLIATRFTMAICISFCKVHLHYAKAM